MGSFPLRSPDDLKEVTAAQAETERYFATRAARSSPSWALEILARAGQGRPPEPGDELPPDLAP